MGTLAEQFFDIFSGLDRAHGWYENVSAEAGKKAKGKAITRQAPVTVRLWEDHLSGKASLGIVPLRADHTCRFGAIDVDDYSTDLPALVGEIHARELPLILCRTKSGGAHLYLFTKTPVPSKLIRQKLNEWAHHLGFVNKKGEVNVEIFPKQDHFEEDVSTGNWINMPYFGGEDSLRYAIGRRALTPEEFVAYVVVRSVLDTDTLESISPRGLNKAGVADEVVEDLFEAPPCLQHLATSGFPTGGRNNGLFNLAIYAKKRFPDTWEAQTAKYNEQYMQPPLPKSESDQTLKSVARKSYGYKCKDQPIVSCCDKPTCRKREFGVGGGARIDELGVEFGLMTKVLTKPVIWLWEVNNELLEFTTKDLMSQRQFQERILESINLWPPVVRPNEWQKMIQEATARAESKDVPNDATSAGQVWDHLAKFCTSRLQGKSMDELLMGRPFMDGERSYFVSSDFISYLIQHRFPGKANERDIYLILREKGLEHHSSILKGKPFSYWSVPAFTLQTEEHVVPREQPKDAM